MKWNFKCIASLGLMLMLLCSVSVLAVQKKKRKTVPKPKSRQEVTTMAAGSDHDVEWQRNKKTDQLNATSDRNPNENYTSPLGILDNPGSAPISAIPARAEEVKYVRGKSSLTLHWNGVDYLLFYIYDVNGKPLRLGGGGAGSTYRGCEAGKTTDIDLPPGTYVLKDYGHGGDGPDAFNPYQFTVRPGQVTHLTPLIGHVTVHTSTSTNAYGDPFKYLNILSFYDAGGREVYHWQVSNDRDTAQTIDLAPGTYTVKVDENKCWQQFSVTVRNGQTTDLYEPQCSVPREP